VKDHVDYCTNVDQGSLTPATGNEGKNVVEYYCSEHPQHPNAPYDKALYGKKVFAAFQNVKTCVNGCKDGKCKPATTASCTDGIKNQDETGVDCGGVCSGQGKKCPNGGPCAANSDCVTNYCSGGTCQLWSGPGDYYLSGCTGYEPRATGGYVYGQGTGTAYKVKPGPGETGDTAAKRCFQAGTGWQCTGAVKMNWAQAGAYSPGMFHRIVYNC